MRLRASIFVLMLHSATTVAAESPMQGVWQGTVGEQKVMVCFDDLNRGEYYYLRRMTGIELTGQTATGTWLEGRKEMPSGTWKLEPVAGDTLSGQWNDPLRKRTLPIRLARVATMDAVRSCDSHASYTSPRVDAQKITLGEIKRFEGKPYRRISTLNGKVSYIQLATDEPQLAGINDLLRKQMNSWIAEYFDCRSVYARDSANQQDGWADFVAEAKIVLWTESLLSLQESSYCSRMAGSKPAEYRSLDLATGQEIDLRTWLNPKAFRKTKYDYSESTAAFGRVLAARWGARGRECTENISNPGGLTYTPQYPTRKGVVFAPNLSGYMNACRDPITLTFNQLMPFLSDEGKVVVESIIQSNRNLKTSSK